MYGWVNNTRAALFATVVPGLVVAFNIASFVLGCARKLGIAVFGVPHGSWRGLKKHFS